MKRFWMRSMIAGTLLLISWVLIAPGCMTFRKADAVHQKAFAQKGVALTTATDTIDHRHIHYALTGADSLPTLVFIHGTPGSWDAFASYLQDSTLLQHFRMIALDRPGFGYSDFGDVLHLEAQAEVLNPVIRQLDNGQPVYLAGHSLGGPLVVAMAASMPGFYDGLILISGSVDPSAEKPEKWRPWISNTPLKYLVPGAFRPSNKELWYLKKDLVTLKPAFARINCPVLLIHGEKDTWVPPVNADYAKEMLIQAPWTAQDMIPEGNHFIPWTYFERIRDDLITFAQQTQQPD